MDDTPVQVLLIEDDPNSAEQTIELLNDLGFRCEHCVDGRHGLERALANHYALVISDLGLPTLGGMEVCRSLRQAKPDQAILVLTAEQDEFKAVLALELGADEFVRKPFSAMELRARIRAVLRRAGRALPPAGESEPEPQLVQFEELTIDNGACQVLIDGKVVPLTATEYDLLIFLAARPGRTFSREDIVSSLWGDSALVYEMNIRSHISRLRGKLKQAGASHEFVTTQRGFGYRFSCE